MPFDAVITVGGQSFIDGLWRILAPALQRLTNPLPLALPGFTNAQVMITDIVPVFPGNLGGEGLQVALSIEATAEALLQVVTETGAVSIALGPQKFDLDSLTGDLDIPEQTGALSKLTLVGGGLGTGALDLPATTATLSDVNGLGTLHLPDSLSLPGLPLPNVIPVALNFTQGSPLTATALVPLAVSGPIAATRQSILFNTVQPAVQAISALTTVNAITNQINATVASLVGQLGVPAGIVQPIFTALDVQKLLGPVTGVIENVINDALSLLIAETGRIVFPPPGASASCDAKMLPTVAAVHLLPTPGNGFELQVGLSRGINLDDIPAFPAPSQNALIEVRVLIGNRFLLSLLCCLVEGLPSFSLPTTGAPSALAAPSTMDVAGGMHTACCNFLSVTAEFGSILLGGGATDGISVCIDGPADGPKTLSLVGSFSQTVPNVVPAVGSIFPTLATVAVTFAVPLDFDLNDVAALANLRPFGKPTKLTASVTPSIGLLGSIILVIVFLLAVPLAVAAAVGFLVAPVVVPLVTLLPVIAAGIITIGVFLACGVANFILSNAVSLVLRGASLLTSPVAIPPGILEAFGKISPVSLTIDDATAPGVMHTPTSVWGLLPRIGLSGLLKPFEGITSINSASAANKPSSQVSLSK